jgi:hypothetical protein
MGCHFTVPPLGLPRLGSHRPPGLRTWFPGREDTCCPLKPYLFDSWAQGEALVGFQAMALVTDNSNRTGAAIGLRQVPFDSANRRTIGIALLSLAVCEPLSRLLRDPALRLIPAEYAA